MEIVTEDLPEYAWFDSPSALDWKYSEVVPAESGGSTKINTKILQKLLTAFSQYKHPKTQNACWWYGLIQNTNWQQILQDNDWGVVNQLNPANRWIEWNDWARPWEKYRGTSIQTNTSVFRQNGWIAWHATCNWIEESKRALDNWDLIYTWSNNGRWYKTYETGIYHTKKNWPWHLFMVYAYDDDEQMFYGFDSNWPKYGTFKIKYSDWNSLYSKNAIFVNDNADLILKYRTMSQFDKEFETAIKQGITNGADPHAPSSVKRTSVIALRAKEQAKKEVKEEMMDEVKAYIDVKLQPIIDMLKAKVG